MADFTTICKNRLFESLNVVNRLGIFYLLVFNHTPSRMSLKKQDKIIKLSQIKNAFIFGGGKFKTK